VTTPDSVGRAEVGPAASVRANRQWWDADADAYHAEHGALLGVADFVWCPENLREEDAALLGPVDDLAGRRVLEVGCGAAMCSQWLAARGVRAVGIDLSTGMLRHARRGGAASRIDVPLVQADAQALPFSSAAFDAAFTAFGAVPFVADSAAVMREVARVLRPGASWVFATTHPVRWIFPDDPGPAGLTAVNSYFDRSAYVEYAADGTESYVEHHRTLGDRIRELDAAGFRLIDLVEPEWPEGFTAEWGQWSPLRGQIFPGTAIYRCRRD
jgi:ubiquinone/menaquinone biosynthesis C-methylase UbiE